VTNVVSWQILQLADSAFPTGGFAHSGGLEAAVHLGQARAGPELDAFVRGYMWNVGSALIPFVAASHEDPDAHSSLDSLLDATLSSQVVNRGSRTQGRAFLGTCARVFDVRAIDDLARRAREHQVPAHFPPAFGAVLRALESEHRQTLALFLYLALRQVVSAAVRLGALGPYEGQRLQIKHGPTLDEILSACEGRRPREAALVAPVVDLIGATHDGLYSRLFQS